MKLVVVGAGNIGLVTALCFAKSGHDVLCVDINQFKISQLNAGITSIYEPGLETLLNDCLKQKKIIFTSDYSRTTNFSDIIFIAVGTPNLENRQADTASVFMAIEKLNYNSNTQKTFIIKSTVPVGTNRKLSTQFSKHSFISNPEYLREGSAISDCQKPDRIIVGALANTSLELIQSIYKNIETTLFFTDPESAELSKYAANTFLAARISLINEFSRICEKTGANIDDVSKAIGLDSRIGESFLKAGIGFGGSCFPKDIDSLIYDCDQLKENLPVVNSIKSTNEAQIYLFIHKIIDKFKTTDIKRICLWGISFKPNTNDIREAPSLKIIEALLNEHFQINIHDPYCNRLAQDFFKNHLYFNNLFFFNNQFEALKKTDGLMIATEWQDYIKANPSQIKENLQTAVIFDGRNIYDSQIMKKLGFDYYSVGRPN